MNESSNFPSYLRVAIFITGIYFLFEILIAGQSIIVPIIYAGLFAILLNPVVRLFTRFGLNRVLSIMIALILALILIAMLIIFLSTQVTLFSESLPLVIDKFYKLLDEGVNHFSGRFNISVQTIKEWLAKTKGEELSKFSFGINSAISGMESMLFVLLIIPVYIFMISFYKPLLMEFLQKVVGKLHRQKVDEFLSSTNSLIQNYLIGLIIEAAIVAIMYSTGLLIIGIEYPLLLGIIGALLNIIPYLGGVMAVALYMLIAFTTKDSASYVFWVAALFVFVHVVDNSYIIPKVVAGKVKINALVAITAVLTGGAIWGVSGMFLAIPLTGVIKLVFDRIEMVKPFGFLLGDTMPDIINFKIKMRKKKNE
ncbi:MAG: AI-2E family transporter [Saprospiraceae bacterium]